MINNNIFIFKKIKNIENIFHVNVEAEFFFFFFFELKKKNVPTLFVIYLTNSFNSLWPTYDNFIEFIMLERVSGPSTLVKFYSSSTSTGKDPQPLISH
jgi:hypothetical protein